MLNSKSSRIRSVLSNWAGLVATAVINFFLSPFVVNSLGDVSYGIWILLGSLVGYMGLLDLGVRSAVTRFIARFHEQGTHQESTRIASTSLVIFSVIGLFVIIISGLLAYFVNDLFDIPHELFSVAKTVVFLSGLNIALSLISGVYGGIVVGLQRFDLVNSAEISIGIVRATAVLAALYSGLGLVALALIQLAATTLRGLASYYFSRRVYPEVKATFAQCRKTHIRLIFSFSSSVVALQASGMIILYSDSIVIGTFLPIGMITFFAIAGNLIEYARAPITGISHTLNPWASSLQARESIANLSTGILVAARISTLVALPIVLTFMLRGESFIGLWMGAEYASTSGNVLWILSLSLWFAVSYQTTTATMIGISEHRGLVPIFACEAICNILLSIYLLRSHGIIGVAWGTAIPRLFVSMIIGPWYIRQRLSTPIMSFWLSVWIRPTLAMIPFAIGSVLLERFWPADSLLLYFSQVVVVLPLAVLGAWLLGLTSMEKQSLLDMRRKIGSAKRLN